MRAGTRATPRRRGVPGDRGAARQRHHPPRRDPREPAAEHRPRRPDQGADRRPGRGQVDGGRGRGHDDRRYPLLHGAGAGRRGAAPGPPGGHLLADRGDLRAADRRPAVRHPQHRRHPGPRPGPGARADRRAARRSAQPGRGDGRRARRRPQPAAADRAGAGRGAGDDRPADGAGQCRSGRAAWTAPTGRPRRRWSPTPTARRPRRPRRLARPRCRPQRAHPAVDEPQPYPDSPGAAAELRRLAAAHLPAGPVRGARARPVVRPSPSSPSGRRAGAPPTTSCWAWPPWRSSPSRCSSPSCCCSDSQGGRPPWTPAGARKQHAGARRSRRARDPNAVRTRCAPGRSAARSARRAGPPRPWSRSPPRR